MKIPVQIAFQELDVSDAIEAACWKEAEKLERHYDRITSCRVTISEPHRRHRKGNHFHVRIVMVVPRGEIVVDRAPPEHDTDERVEVAVREAFQQARRQLEDHVRKMRGETKRRGEPVRGRVGESPPEEERDGLPSSEA